MLDCKSAAGGRAFVLLLLDAGAETRCITPEIVDVCAVVMLFCINVAAEERKRCFGRCCEAPSSVSVGEETKLEFDQGAVPCQKVRNKP